MKKLPKIMKTKRLPTCYYRDIVYQNVNEGVNVEHI